MTTGADAISRVQFTVTREDVEALYREYWTSFSSTEATLAHLRKRRKLWLATTIIGTCICVAYLIALAMAWTASEGPLFAGFIIATLYSWWTLTNTREQLVAARHNATMTRQMEEVGMDLYLGSCSIAIKDSGMEVVTTHFETKYNWSIVLDAVCLEDSVRVNLIGPQVIRVPSRAFEAPNTPDQFRGLINARVAQAGFSPASRVVCYINRKKLHCPHCKYPLQGLSEAQCPECGKQLTLKEFPAAAGTIP